MQEENWSEKREECKVVAQRRVLRRADDHRERRARHAVTTNILIKPKCPTSHSHGKTYSMQYATDNHVSSTWVGWIPP